MGFCLAFALLLYTVRSLCHTVCFLFVICLISGDFVACECVFVSFTLCCLVQQQISSNNKIHNDKIVAILFNTHWRIPFSFFLYHFFYFLFYTSCVFSFSVYTMNIHKIHKCVFVWVCVLLFPCVLWFFLLNILFHIFLFKIAVDVIDSLLNLSVIRMNVFDVMQLVVCVCFSYMHFTNT